MANKIVRLGVILFGITAGTGLILGTVQHITSEPIAAQRAQQKLAALAATLPGAVDFIPVNLKDAPAEITEIYCGVDASGATVGYNYTVTTKGFGGQLTLIAGLNNEGRVMDISILESHETPGLGARASQPAFAGQFHERQAAGPLTVVKSLSANAAEANNEILAISGATITSNAVTSAVNAARGHFAANFQGRQQ